LRLGFAAFDAFSAANTENFAIMRSRRRLDEISILVKKARDHCRVQIGSNLIDDLSREMDNPAVASVEPNAVLCGRQRAELDDGFVVSHHYMFHDELRTQRHDPIRKAAGKKVTLGAVVSSEGMGSFNHPIDIIGDMVEELASIAVLQSSKDLTHVSFTNSHPFLQSSASMIPRLILQGGLRSRG
jgi:hypothetical protein